MRRRWFTRKRVLSVGCLLIVCLVLLVACCQYYFGLPFSFAPSSRHVSQQEQQGGPYGVTVLDILGPQTITDLQQLGVHWVRYQMDWEAIEPQPGQYHWQQLDAALTLANAHGIRVTFPLQGAPTWALSQVCTGRPRLPGANEMARFAAAVAQRYDGQHGHGYIDSYEVGNEEFDNIWTGDWLGSLSCRQPDLYGPVLKAAYTAIKAQSPHALVGMFGLWWENMQHIRSYMNWLYQNNYGSYFDFANYHYYVCNNDPAVTVETQPSFNEEWQTIHDMMARSGDGNKPIWVTEVGWPINSTGQSAQCIVTPQIQANYLRYVLNQASASHVVTHVFWYTVDRGTDGMSLTQDGRKLPAFSTLQQMVQHQPLWS